MERRGIEEWSGHFGIVPGFRSTASGLRSLPYLIDPCANFILIDCASFLAGLAQFLDELRQAPACRLALLRLNNDDVAPSLDTDIPAESFQPTGRYQETIFCIACTTHFSILHPGGFRKV